MQSHPWRPDGHISDGDFVILTGAFAPACGFVQGKEDDQICVICTEEVPGLSDNLPHLQPSVEDADELIAQETEDRKAAQARAAAGVSEIPIHQRHIY